MLQFVVDSRGAVMWVHILTTLMTRTVVDKSTDHALNHISIFITISTSEMWFSELELWTLIDNGKLANQIVRIAAIVVKSKIIVIT